MTVDHKIYYTISKEKSNILKLELDY